MFDILSNKNIAFYLSLLVFLNLISFSSFCSENNYLKRIEEITLENICKGKVVEDSSLKFTNFPLYDLDEKERKITGNNEFRFLLIFTCSPYLCGSCQRSNIQLVNYFAEKYPERINLVVEDFYIRDTKKNINEIKISNNVNIFLDSKGRNIGELKKLNYKLNGVFYIILDNQGFVKYLVGKSYYYNIDEKSEKKIFEKINKYMKIKS